MLSYFKEKTFYFICMLSTLALITIFVIFGANLVNQSLKASTLFKVKIPFDVSLYKEKNSRKTLITLKDKIRYEFSKKKIDLTGLELKYLINFNDLLDENYTHSNTSRTHTWISTSKQLHDHLNNISEKEIFISARYTKALNKLIEMGLIKSNYNWEFFQQNDSSDPQNAGIKQALIGSLWVILLTVAISLPSGLSIAIHNMYFISNKKFKTFMRIHLTNLASVPSIIYGVLGLYIFINIFHIPRSSVLVAALTLSLLAVPMIYVISMNAFENMPKEIIESAYALGETKTNIIFKHILPSSFPTIVTGLILTCARVIGETAPLLMVGMVAYIAAPAENLFDPSTTLPVQIYSWINNPDPAFLSKSSLGIIMLLLLILALNLIAKIIKKLTLRKY